MQELDDAPANQTMLQVLDITFALHLQGESLVNVCWVFDTGIEMRGTVVVAKMQRAGVHVDEACIIALRTMICVIMPKHSVPEAAIIKVEVFGARAWLCLHTRKVIVVAPVALDNSHVAPKPSGESCGVE